MNNDLHFASGNNEQYTPSTFLDLVYEFFGEVDLDPCSNCLYEPNVKANRHFTKEVNGLELPWFGKVFVNPPYSRDLLPKFINKAISEYKYDNVDEILLLLPSRTDTKWHASLDDYSRCYLKGRLKFINPSNKNNSAPFGSVLFYMGNRKEYFKQFWSVKGKVFIE